MSRSTRQVVALAASVLLAALAPARVAATGVCYSPFHNETYFSQPGAIEQVLATDMQHIARTAGFSAVRTYHAQFYGASVAAAAHSAGLQIAIGIQMVGERGAPYAYLADDIDAAIDAATRHPESVLAIYAGNENLRNGDFGSSSADEIIAVITKVKRALAGTKGAHVPVGTVQRLEEWLHASGADRVAAACDVVGVNIYPFFTRGGERDMAGALAAQWALATAKLGAKARLTETGWPSFGSVSDAGNAPTLANAQKYFAAFAHWTASSAQTRDAFYFMMYDLLSTHASDYEQHFGVATAAGTLKFPLATVLADVVTTTSGTATQITATADVTSVVTPAATKSNETATSVQDSEVAGESDRSLDAGFAPAETTTTTTAWPVPTPTVVASSAIGNAASATSPSTSALVTNSSTHAVSVDSTTSAPSVSLSAALTPTPKIPHAAGSSSLDVTTGSGIGSHDVGFGSGSGSIGGSIDSSSSASTVPKIDPDVGDVSDHNNAPVAAPDVAKHSTFAPVPSETSVSKAKEQEILAQEARAKRERAVAGDQGMAVQALTIGIGFAGVAAIAVIAVYMQKRRNESEHRVSITTADARESTPSVYSDPLGTRFSSIVMITPNGDGVCIL